MSNPENIVRRVTVGDRELTIPPFRGMKALRAGAILARVSKKVPTILDEVAAFRRHYGEQNSLRITPALAAARGYEIPAEQFGEQGYIEIPGVPDTGEIVFAVFPSVFDVAETEVVRLLALIAMPNSELKAADEADQLDEALSRFGRELLYEGELAELAELVLIAYEMLGEQFAGKQDRLGKLRLAFLRETSRTPTTSESSSTVSPRSMDGPAAKSSSKSRGRTSKATSSA